MKGFIRFAFLPFCAFLMGACDAFEYHPYDVNISGHTNLNAQNIDRIERNCYRKDTIRFALLGDTHRWYDQSRDFVRSINARNDLDFVIHLGDITDFGLPKEFQLMRDVLLGLRIPWVALIGNHDVLGNGKDCYRIIFGADNFSFVAGNTKFLCMNTCALEYDYSYPVPDFNWIKEELRDTASITRTVAAMHVKPGDEQFNNNVKDIFQHYLKQFPGLSFALHSHNHAILTEDLFNDGIVYYGEANIKQRHYFVFTLYPSGHAHEEIFF